MEADLIHRKRRSNLVDHDLGLDIVLISASRGQQDLPGSHLDTLSKTVWV